MSLNALVAEPDDAAWNSIQNGIRHHFPDASLLRVKDGEQALRFLLHRGLPTEDPEVTHLVVLAAELPVVSADRVFVRLRQEPSTRATPAIVRWYDHGKVRVDLPVVLLAQRDLLVIRGPDALEAQAADAVYRLCAATACVTREGGE